MFRQNLNYKTFINMDSLFDTHSDAAFHHLETHSIPMVGCSNPHHSTMSYWNGQHQSHFPLDLTSFGQVGQRKCC